MEYVDCIVIGGGAAGLFCAAMAGQRGRSVRILDHANKVGKKILMSGGGRCNFTNYFVEPDNFLSSNPYFCISALSRFTQYDFLELVGKYHLQYHEKTLGQLFCDNKAKDILAILLAECEAGNVDIRTHCDIIGVENKEVSSKEVPDQQARFHLKTSQGDMCCHSLVIATGGLSIPTMGATGLGYDLAKQFGLRVKPRYASLVPFTLKNTSEQSLLQLVQSLAGVSLPVQVSCGDQSFSEGLLFTHKGLSGPSILQISNYWSTGEEVTINFLPTESLSDLFDVWKQENQKADVKNLLSRYLPKRLVQAWFEYYSDLRRLSEKPIAQLSKQEIEIIVNYFQAWTAIPAGTEGYKTAEVTKGGVDTNDLSSKTFEAKKTKGLFFVGEVVDVTGWLGGYNFQWAWSSGYCAAQYV